MRNQFANPYEQRSVKRKASRMKSQARVIIYAGASATWATGLLVTIAIAHWLRLAAGVTVVLVVGICCLALASIFLPAVQMGLLHHGLKIDVDSGKPIHLTGSRSDADRV